MFYYLRNIFKVKLKLVFDWLGVSFFFVSIFKMKIDTK